MDDTIIRVEDVGKVFKLPHEKNTSIKSAVINFYRRKRTFELQEALKGVTFDVKNGDFFGIIGRNGSGKSTLLKLLAGIYTPTGGSISINGTLTPFIELGVGFNAELTGRENVFLNGALLGFNRKDMNTMYKDIVEFAELEKFMDQKLKNYSSGMQVRLAFSIAIRAKSDILLLDEVLAVGDAAFQQKCYDYFEELKLKGQTVVFVSHDMGAIRRFCTKAVYLDNGKITYQGAPSDIAEVYTLANIENNSKKLNDGYDLTERHRISIKISKQTEGSVLAAISYESADKDEMYVGISIIKDGVSVAEINTLPKITLVGGGKLHYSLDTSMLNGGVYHIAAALFKVENKQLITFTGDKAKFVVKSDNSSRGAALKLANTWKRG